MSQLWHFRSDTLGGFYASEVYAVADNLDQAIERALSAFSEWVAKYEADYGFMPLVDDGFNDLGLAAKEMLVIVQRFIEEAQFKFKPVGFASIFHRS